MDHFEYRDIDGQARLFAEEVDLRLIAEQFGTPCYVYSRATIEHHYRVFEEAFGNRPHGICFSVKANSNIAVLNVLARLGSGFDIVSGGELERVLRAGGDPAKVVFSGVGKAEWEMRRALEVGIRCFNVESEPELALLSAVASEMAVTAPVSLRVNPDVDAKTHPYISTGLKGNKFGIDIAQAERVYALAASLPGIRVSGVDCHIGSQLTDTEPFVDAMQRVMALIDRLATQGIVLHHLDIGGGVGIRYKDENPPSPQEFGAALVACLGDRELEILLEPGRAMVGNAGLLLTRVELLKEQGDKQFAIVDAAMNDLLRPALYNAWQDVLPLAPHGDQETALYDIVGPVCETGDWLARERELALVPGDLLALRSAGAYGFTMSSNYNSRRRPPEIMVDGSQVHVVRARESFDDLMRGEALLPE